MSDPYRGPRDSNPYVPSWMFPGGARECECGHHEGFHSDSGACKACECRTLSHRVVEIR